MIDCFPLKSGSWPNNTLVYIPFNKHHLPTPFVGFHFEGQVGLRNLQSTHSTEAEVVARPGRSDVAVACCGRELSTRLRVLARFRCGRMEVLFSLQEDAIWGHERLMLFGRGDVQGAFGIFRLFFGSPRLVHRVLGPEPGTNLDPFTYFELFLVASFVHLAPRCAQLRLGKVWMKALEGAASSTCGPER